MKFDKGNFTVHIIIFFILVGILILAFKKINIYILLFPLLFTFLNIYIEEIHHPKVFLKRKKTINSLLFEKYKNGKELSENYFSSKVYNRNIIFLYSSNVSSRGYKIQNSLAVYLDISHLDENIKRLCKIHFYCKNIDDKEYIYSNVTSSFFSNSLKTLTNNSDKTIKSIIQKSEKYIIEKKNKNID